MVLNMFALLYIIWRIRLRNISQLFFLFYEEHRVEELNVWEKTKKILDILQENI